MIALAEQYRSECPRVFDSIEEWILWLEDFDRESSVENTDLGPVIRFSDGSLHRIQKFA